MFTVYMHVTPNQKRYIGITSKNVNDRWLNGRGYKCQKYFYKAIQKYGWDNIEHIIIAENLTEQEAITMEKELILKYETNNCNKGYNISKGGYSGYDYTLQEDTRKKISNASKEHWKDPIIRQKMMEGIAANPQVFDAERLQKMSENRKQYIKENPESFQKFLDAAHQATKGKPSWNKGIKGVFHHSDETKKKMSKSQKGKVLSEETKRKIGEKSSQRKMSEENKRKLAERNRNMSEETRQKISNTLKQRWKEGCFENSKKSAKGRIPWNKGLTKETDDRVRQGAEKQCKRLLSEENKKKLHDGLQKYLQEQGVWNSKSVRCIETGKIYKSITEAEKDIGKRGINQAISRNGKCGGFRWEILENEYDK